MVYEYECESCQGRTERHAKAGMAPRTAKCAQCGASAKRIFSSFAIGINGSIDRKSTFGESVKKKNDQAADRMRGRKAPVRTIAHDYGNGDIREVKNG